MVFNAAKIVQAERNGKKNLFFLAFPRAPSTLPEGDKTSRERVGASQSEMAEKSIFLHFEASTTAPEGDKTNGKGSAKPKAKWQRNIFFLAFPRPPPLPGQLRGEEVVQAEPKWQEKSIFSCISRAPPTLPQARRENYYFFTTYHTKLKEVTKKKILSLPSVRTIKQLGIMLVNGIFAFLNLGTARLFLLWLSFCSSSVARRFPELMRGLGKGVKSFKQGMNEIEDEIKKPIEDLDKDKELETTDYAD